MRDGNLFNLEDRVALITGGAGFLGRDFCSTLANAGAKVVVADENGSEATRVAESIGSSAMAIETDVSNPDSVKQLMTQTVSKHGGIDILVNGAALNPKFDSVDRGKHTSSFEEYPLETWDRSLAVNLTGAFLCSQAAGVHMLSGEGGVIVNVCSTYGLVGPDQRIYQREGKPTEYKPVDYSVTKAGLLGLTRYLASYYAGQNIRVNALSPGGVMNEHDDEFVRNYSSRTILGRMAEPDELRGAILFLASDASSYMTGANLIVDGGWTAW
jgi:2-deoxy-D-gluconate 3-dehydrogenase